MKILYIISGLKFGGAEKLLYYTCKAMKNRHQVGIDVVCLDPTADLAPLFTEIGISVRILEKNPFVLVKLFKLLAQERYQVVHTHLIHADTYGRLGALGCRILYHPLIFSTVHDNYWFRREPSWRGILVRAMDRLLARPNDSWVLPVSDTIAQTLLRYERIPADKIKRLINAVEIPVDVKNRSRTLDHGLRCLFIGRLIPEKNIPCLLQALQRLADPRISLTLVGEGPLEDRIKNLIREFGLEEKVRLCKPIPHPETFYQQHDVLILPSILEGLPMVILEAFSHRLAVIGSDIPGIRELLNEGRGILFASGDPLALAGCIRHALVDFSGFPEMTDKAFSFAKEHHSMEQYVDTLYRLYKDGTAS